jgi:protein-S-isoprenylcysteine O-methyltransferase Ste14
MEPALLIAACWILYLLYWAISARSAKPAAERQRWAGMLANRLPLMVGAILLFVPWADPFRAPITSQSVAMKWLGAAMVFLGLFGAIWSRRILADNWSANVEFKEGHKLVERGPYRFARHPIYTSILLMILGTAFSSNRLVALAAFPFFFIGFFIKLKQEERLMLRHFPDEYAAYKSRTKMLVPLVF